METQKPPEDAQPSSNWRTMAIGGGIIAVVAVVFTLFAYVTTLGNEPAEKQRPNIPTALQAQLEKANWHYRWTELTSTGATVDWWIEQGDDRRVGVFSTGVISVIELDISQGAESRGTTKQLRCSLKSINDVGEAITIGRQAHGNLAAGLLYPKNGALGILSGTLPQGTTWCALFQ